MANLDPVKNFAIVTVSTTYDASATSIALTSGHGARLPAPSTDGSFNLVWWNSTDYSNPADDPNVEIVRVTARSTDTLTVTRAQESTSASTKNTSAKTYKMALVPTKKLRDDIESLIGASTFLSSAELFSDVSPLWKAQGAETFRVYPLPDDSTKFVAGTCVVPAGKTGISSIKLYYYGAGVNGNNIVFNVETSKIDKTSAGNTETTDTTGTNTTVAGTQTGLGILTAPADSFNGLGTLAGGNIIGIKFKREGANGSDTYSSNIDVIGIEIVWS